jgi:hypothetical protein
MRTPALAWLVAGALCVATLAALLLGGGNTGLVVAPALLAGAVFIVWRMPLRWPLFVMTFAALTLENPSEVPAQGQYKSPLYTVGAVLLAHLNVTFPSQHALLFSGLDVVIVLLLAIALSRRTGGASAGGRIQSSPLRFFAMLVLAGTAWLWLWGIARGDADVGSGLWQVQRVVYLPVLFFLFDAGLRGPADAATIGKVVVAAASVRAAAAVYIHATIPPPPGGEGDLTYATTHADSMLFACALCVITIAAFEGLLRARVWLPLGGLLIAGMIANNRRIVWVEIAAALAVAWALSPKTHVKRVVGRAAILASPLLLTYCAAGWSSSDAAVFRPLRVIRSIVDSRTDASTTWRDWENYDLCYTIRGAPLLGTGWGHGYVELVKLPDVSHVYGLYRFAPHNGLLGLWAYGGVAGFFALWTLMPVGVFLAARAHARAQDGAGRVAALSAAGAIVVHSVHCYGDTGLGSWTSLFTVAPALAVAGQLATATGAWTANPVVPQVRPA